MLTSLLMLMGLAGAGAGAARILKGGSGSKRAESGGESSGDSSRRRRRKQESRDFEEQESSEEPSSGSSQDIENFDESFVEPSSPRSSKSDESPSSSRPPFPRKPPKPEKKRPKGKPFSPKAREQSFPSSRSEDFEEEEEEEDWEGEDWDDSEEDTPPPKQKKSKPQPKSRQRAKRQPERSFPDLETPLDHEEDDFDPDSAHVPFKADDILKNKPKYSHHKRPLQNAEAMVEKQNLRGAIEVYLRTEARIPDQEIREKIRKNRENLEKFEERKSQSLLGGEDAEPFTPPGGSLGGISGGGAVGVPSGQAGDPGNVTGTPLPFSEFVTAIKELSQAVAENMAKSFSRQDLGKEGMPSGQDPSSPWGGGVGSGGMGGGNGGAMGGGNASSPSASLPGTSQGSNTASKIPTSNDSSYDPSSAVPIIPSDQGGGGYGGGMGGGGSPGGIGGGNGGTMGGGMGGGGAGGVGGGVGGASPAMPLQVSDTQGLPYQLKELPPMPGEQQSGKFPALFPQPIVYQLVPYAGGQNVPGQTASPNAGNTEGPGAALKDLLDNSPPPTIPGSQNLSPPPPEKPNWETAPISDLDLPPDTFFTEEWKKFKDLPLEDRRKAESRRGSSEGERDRRGEDRRKENLFEEREEYLRSKAKEKEEAQFDSPEGSASISELLRSGLEKADLEKIGLPDPDYHDKEMKETPSQSGDESSLDGVPGQAGAQQTGDGVSGGGGEGGGSIEGTLVSPISEQKSGIGLPSPEDDLTLPSTRKIFLPDAIDPNFVEESQVTQGEGEFSDSIAGPGAPSLAPAADEDRVVDGPEPPEIEMVDGNLGELPEAKEVELPEEEKEPEKVIHGVLELKPPEVDDAPFLTLTYDFAKIPHAFRLSKNYSIMEYSYYKYKPMLMKAQEFARRKMLKNALNYYRVIKSQNIPPEMRKMINRNIRDITEFMEKFLMSKGD